MTDLLQAMILYLWLGWIYGQETQAVRSVNNEEYYDTFLRRHQEKIGME